MSLEIKGSHNFPEENKNDDVQLLLKNYETSHEKFDDFTESDVGKVFEWARKFVNNETVSMNSSGNGHSEQAQRSMWNHFSLSRMNMTLLLGGRLHSSYCTSYDGLCFSIKPRNKMLRNVDSKSHY